MIPYRKMSEKTAMQIDPRMKAFDERVFSRRVGGEVGEWRLLERKPSTRSNTIGWSFLSHYDMLWHQSFFILECDKNGDVTKADETPWFRNLVHFSVEEYGTYLARPRHILTTFAMTGSFDSCRCLLTSSTRTVMPEEAVIMTESPSLAMARELRGCHTVFG
jgi:hypothetical protein